MSGTAARLSHDRRLPRRCLFAAVMTLVVIAVARGDDPPQTTWKVPIHVMGRGKSSSQSANEMASPARPTPPANSVSPLPPQYQTGNWTGQRDERPVTDPEDRFLLPLPERLVVIAARITIDGQPFRQVRESRVQQLLDDLKTPAPQAETTPAANTEAAESEAGPTANAADQATSKESTEGANPVGDSSASSSEPDEPPSNHVLLVGRMQRFVAATGRAPSADDIRWMLQRWIAGPVVLWVDPNFQRARADRAPLFAVLDRDEDGLLSSQEIAEAGTNLWKYDADQNEILSLAEISKAGERTPSNDKTAPDADAVSLPPLVRIEDCTNRRIAAGLMASYESLRKLDADGDQMLSVTEMEAIRSLPADLSVVVDFNRAGPSKSYLEVAVGQSPFATNKVIQRHETVTLAGSQTLIEFSGVQSADDPEADQISIGAVRDGYPMLPELDVNEDGQLTFREIREAPRRLMVFDQDGDGKIARDELRPTLRVCIGLGPVAHVPLAAVRSLHTQEPTTPANPPDWFVRMDRNKDGDVTPREFLGGEEQFQSLDKDHDGLISAAESQPDPSESDGG